MPLRLNFLHERQQAQKERRKDPLKLGVLGILVIFLIMAALYIYTNTKSRGVRNELADVERQWQEREPRLLEAQEKEEELRATIELSTALERYANSRFYWAPLLSQVLKSIPPEAQLTSFTGSLNDGNEEVTAAISGITAGSEPRSVAEKIRRTLEDRLSELYPEVEVQFSSLEEGDSMVQINTMKYPTARFALAVSFRVRELQSEENATEEPTG